MPITGRRRKPVLRHYRTLRSLDLEGFSGSSIAIQAAKKRRAAAKRHAIDATLLPLAGHTFF
ncbi:hypothetical protein ACIPZ5_20185 [Pseudomonas sp. NPDC089428]|uniref:hypothetical protein n=1 Tax=Pseudomonas sp. NPDC089428 TaxID=3364467 RepID=UPI0037FA77DE